MSPIKIFPYVEPNIKIGKMQKYVIKLYKLPDSNDKNFIKINNVNKQKAYNEFYTYINANRLLPVNTFRYLVRGDSDSSVNLLNMLMKSNSKLSKQAVKL